MTTVIDALIVSLGLDAKEFKKGTEDTNKALEDTKQRAETSARSITESQTKTQESFRDTGSNATSAASAIEKGAARSHTAVRQLDTGITAASKSIGEAGKTMLAPFAEFALGVGAAVLSIDGIKKAIGGAINQAGVDSAVGRAASMSGIPVGDFSTYGKASQLLGGDANASMSTMASLAQQQQAALFGEISPQMQLLRQLDINPSQPIPDIMKALNRRLQGMPQARQSYVLSQLGFDSGSAYLEEQTPAQYDATIAQASRDKINPAQSAAEQGITQAYGGVLQALDNLGRDVTSDSAPNLIRMLDGLKDFVNWVDTTGGKWFYNTFSNKAITGDAKSIASHFTNKALAADWSDVTNFVEGARGVRNNNPLNLKYAGQAGAHADRDGFAVFPTMKEGILADYHQMMLDYGRGDNTINKLVPAWTTTDRTAYAATVLKRMKALGYNINGDSPVDLTDPVVAQAMISSMSVAEGNGKIWSNSTAANGSLSPNVTNVLAGMRSAASSSGATVHHHGGTEINVTVHAPSGDPHAIASAVTTALKRQTQRAANSAGGGLM